MTVPISYTTPFMLHSFRKDCTKEERFLALLKERYPNPYRLIVRNGCRSLATSPMSNAFRCITQDGRCYSSVGKTSDDWICRYHDEEHLVAERIKRNAGLLGRDPSRHAARIPAGEATPCQRAACSSP